MVRTTLVLAALTVSLPEGCSSALERVKGGARPKDKATPVATSAAATAATSTPATSTAAPARTTPPVWMPPAPPVVLPPPTIEPDGGRPLSAEMKKALEAFEVGDHKKVKALLEKRVRSGKGTVDEARFLAASCTTLKDKACTDAANAVTGGQ